MKEFEKAEREIMSGDKADIVKRAVDSKEGRSVGKMVDGAALKKAVLTGDSKTVSAILGKVLSTEEGKTLADRVNRQLGGK